jgi:hypothetical protein
MEPLKTIRSMTNEELVRKISIQEKEIQELKALLKESFDQNSFLLGKLDRHEIKTNLFLEYSQRWSWINKIIYILRELDKPSTSSDIVNLMLEFDADLRFNRDIVKYLSPHFTKAVKYGRIIQHKIKGIKGYYYILPGWIDEVTNVLKQEYKNKIVELR